MKWCRVPGASAECNAPHLARCTRHPAPVYFCALLVALFVCVASPGLTACGTVSVRLYFASDALTADAFAMTAFRSAIAFGVCDFTSVYARVVWSPTTMPPM